MAADIRWWHPELPVVIKAGPAAPPAGCVSILACCSVKGQVDAVRRALQKAAADKPHENEPAACTPAEIRDRLHARLAEARRPPATRGPGSALNRSYFHDQCRKAAGQLLAP